MVAGARRWACVIGYGVGAAALAGAATLVGSGCTPISALGAVSNYEVVTPAYTGLIGQSVGVMAWADEGTRYDFDGLILDVTQGISRKLVGAQQRGVKELKGTTFPKSADPAALFAFQSRHLETAADPIVDVAPKLGVTRLIYVEIDGLDLHSGQVVDLFRGSLTGTLEVIEVKNGKGTIAFHANVAGTYPPHSPQEGLPNLSAQQTYIGTVDAFCTEAAKKLVPYSADASMPGNAPGAF